MVETHFAHLGFSGLPPLTLPHPWTGRPDVPTSREGLASCPGACLYLKVALGLTDRSSLFAGGKRQLNGQAFSSQPGLIWDQNNRFRVFWDVSHIRLRPLGSLPFSGGGQGQPIGLHGYANAQKDSGKSTVLLNWGRLGVLLGVFWVIYSLVSFSFAGCFPFCFYGNS